MDHLEVCAETGHAWIEVFLYRCPHSATRFLSLHYGPNTATADHESDGYIASYGPFDDDDQALNDLIRQLMAYAP